MMIEAYANHDLAVFAGYLTDDEKLMRCASGGIATAFAESIIERGGGML